MRRNSSSSLAWSHDCTNVAMVAVECHRNRVGECIKNVEGKESAVGLSMPHRNMNTYEQISWLASIERINCADVGADEMQR
jgi:hypothetical protein